MTDLLADLRFAARVLRKSPALAVAAVASLALAIGATTAVFALADAMLLDPVAVGDPERLVSVFTTDPRNQGGPMAGALPVSFPNFEDLRDGPGPFSGLALFLTLPVNLLVDGRPEEVPAQVVSADYFALLGVGAARGRVFHPGEDRPLGAHPVAVISHGLWRRRFAADPAAVGRTLEVNGHTFTVVGVAPPGFTGLTLIPAPELWLPMSMHPQLLAGPFAAFLPMRRALMFDVVGRLGPEASPAAARDWLAARGAALAERYPDDNRERSFILKPAGQANLPGGVRGEFVRAAGLGGVAAGAILVIACANVVNLLLVRAAGRRAEIASRLALGATPRRLLRQLLTEGALLGAVGGAVGLVVAWWGRRALWALRPPVLAESAPDLAFDARVVGFALLVTGLTCAVLGLVPALWARRTDVATALRSRQDAHGGGARGGAIRAAVVGAQVALSVVALVGCGLFVRALGRAQQIDPGFAADRLAVVTVNLGARGYDPVSGQEFFRRALEAVGATPQVASAAWAANLPLVPIGFLMRSVVPEGEPLAGDRRELLAGVDPVSPGFFATAGVPLVRGRAFTDGDRAGAAPVAIVNETLAARLWPGRDPVGERFRFPGETAARTVVGVARDAKYQVLGEEPTPYLYQPLLQEYADRATLYVRPAQGDPQALLPTVLRQVQALDSGLPLTGATTMAEVLERSLWAPRLGAILLGLSAALALALTGVGLYGVAAFAAGERRREIGIRMALGGDRDQVVRQLVGRGLKPVAVGLVLGLVGSFLLTRSIASLLYGVSAADPAAYVGAALLAVVGLVANLLPARRAAALAPAAVLREE
jgi:putative ABC transport system permease protein